MNLYEPERNAIQIYHHSFVKVTIFVMQKLMHCTMCTASIRLATVLRYMYALYSVSAASRLATVLRYMHALYSVSAASSVAIRVYHNTPLNVGFTILVHMSNCIQ